MYARKSKILIYIYNDFRRNMNEKKTQRESNRERTRGKKNKF